MGNIALKEWDLNLHSYHSRGSLLTTSLSRFPVRCSFKLTCAEKVRPLLEIEGAALPGCGHMVALCGCVKVYHRPLLHRALLLEDLDVSDAANERVLDLELN